MPSAPAVRPRRLAAPGGPGRCACCRTSRSACQEARCLAGGANREFLERRGVEPDEGAIVDPDGRELGRHDGFWRFTPGQRRGLGVGGGEPLYALRSDPGTNTVVVGPRSLLAVRELEAQGRLHVPVERVEAKLRYKSPAVAARVLPLDTGFRLVLDEPAFGVAPGQEAILYED